MLLRYVLVFSLLLAALAGRAQGARVPVRPPLTAATIYLDGLSLEHRAEVMLGAGLNRLVLRGLAVGFEPASLEVQPGAGGELLAVEAEPVPADPTLLTGQDSLGRARLALAALQAELRGLKQEEAFLLANQTLPAGTQANWSAEVQRGATLMRTRLPAIQRETDLLQAQLTKAQAQYQALTQRTTTTADTQYVLLVQAARAGTVPLTVRYRLPEADAWLPRLNIRADAAGRQLRFELRGTLYNSTSLPWQNVRVALVNYALGTGYARPTLTPWVLGAAEEDLAGEGRVDRFVVKGTAPGKATAAPRSRYELPELLTLAPAAHRDVALAEVALTGQPEYLAVPRLTENVFLQSRVTGWQGLQLPDTADVFRAGSFVGTTGVNTRAYNDSLEIALGHDPQLVVGRAKLEDFSSSAALSSRRHTYLTYELNVLNQHAEAVQLRLLDQVPVSEDKEISVKVLETSGAQLDERSGRLTWLLTLPPGASQRVRFRFEVEYPKSSGLRIFRHRRRISNPKFR